MEEKDFWNIVWSPISKLNKVYVPYNKKLPDASSKKMKKGTSWYAISYKVTTKFLGQCLNTK